MRRCNFLNSCKLNDAMARLKTACVRSRTQIEPIVSERLGISGDAAGPPWLLLGVLDEPLARYEVLMVERVATKIWRKSPRSPRERREPSNHYATTFERRVRDLRIE